MASVSPYPIYTGFWINRSSGVVRGSTLTLKAEHGVLLVAFAAIKVQLISAYLFGAICFVWHQLRVSTKDISNPAQRDVQLTLRNLAVPEKVAYSLLKLRWRWRGRTTSSWTSSIVTAFLAAIYFVSAFVAGLYSSSILESSNIEVLLGGNISGYWMPESARATQHQIEEQQAASGTYLAELVKDSTQYARSCYNADVPKTPSCSVFSAAAVKWKSNHTSHCEFADDLCLGQADAVLLDTGYLDSNLVFGINSDKADTLSIRKITTCTPLDSKPYLHSVEGNVVAELWTEESVSTQDRFEALFYGPTTAPVYPWTWIGHDSRKNNTPSYTLGWQQYLPDLPDTSTFDPIASLKRSDADLTLFFLSTNLITFTEPCDDPLFSAPQPTNIKGWFDGQQLFRGDNIASVLACREQYSFCDASPSSSGKLSAEACTQPFGIQRASESVAALNLTVLQQATVKLFTYAIQEQPSSIVANANAQVPSLLAQQQLVGGSVQLPLPSDQWKLEVEDFHANVLAMLQRWVVDYAAGPPNKSWQKFIQKPEPGTPEDQLCRRIRARTANGDYVNVSVLGMGVIVCVSILILTISVLQTGIAKSLQTKRYNGQTRLEAWNADSIFKLQAKEIWVPEAVTSRSTDETGLSTTLDDAATGVSMSGSSTDLKAEEMSDRYEKKRWTAFF